MVDSMGAAAVRGRARAVLLFSAAVVIHRRPWDVLTHPEATTNVVWTRRKPSPKPETKTERRLIPMFSAAIGCRRS
jgi:hypothetical protein